MNIHEIPGTKVIEFPVPGLMILTISASIMRDPAQALQFLNHIRSCSARVAFQGEGFAVIEALPKAGEPCPGGAWFAGAPMHPGGMAEAFCTICRRPADRH